MARTWTGNAANRISVPVALVAGEPCSFACWFKPANTTNDRTLASLSAPGGSASYHRLYVANGANAPRAQSADGGGVADAVASAGATIGVWAHAAGVWTSGTARAAFLNGGSKGTNATSRTIAGVDTTALGVLRDHTGAFIEAFDGDLSDVGIWSAALDDAEVNALGKGVSPMLIRPQSLILYAPLLGNLSPERDAWRSNTTLTITGTLAKADSRPLYQPIGAA